MSAHGRLYSWRECHTHRLHSGQEMQNRGRWSQGRGQDSPDRLRSSAWLRCQVGKYVLCLLSVFIKNIADIAITAEIKNEKFMVFEGLGEDDGDSDMDDADMASGDDDADFA